MSQKRIWKVIAGAKGEVLGLIQLILLTIPSNIYYDSSFSHKGPADSGTWKLCIEELRQFTYSATF